MLTAAIKSYIKKLVADRGSKIEDEKRRIKTIIYICHSINDYALLCYTMLCYKYILFNHFLKLTLLKMSNIVIKVVLYNYI